MTPGCIIYIGYFAGIISEQELEYPEFKVPPLVVIGIHRTVVTSVMLEFST